MGVVDVWTCAVEVGCDELLLGFLAPGYCLLYSDAAFDWWIEGICSRLLLLLFVPVARGKQSANQL